MDSPSYLKYLTVGISILFGFASTFQLMRHNLYTTFILGFYGLLLSVTMFMFEQYESFANYLIIKIPSLEKHTTKGILYIIIGSLYLGKECLDLSNFVGMLLLFCGASHIVLHFLNDIPNSKYQEGVVTFQRPVVDNTHYDELVM